LAARTFRNDDLVAMLGGLVDDGLEGRYRDYAGAEQATMAIGSLASFLAQRGALRDVAAVRAAIDGLYAEVRNDERYRDANFREALKSVRAAIGRGAHP
jgi:hypothetical protein